MIKKNWVYILFVFSVIIFVISKLRNDKVNSEIEAKSVYLGKGWGAEILVDKKLYITMNRIPSIQGNKLFNSEEQALLVANLAIDKIKKNRGLPNISVRELDSLGIKR